jgi:hypothetical protein
MPPTSAHPITEAPAKVTRAPTRSRLSGFGRSLRGHWGWIVSLFLVTLGAKLWLIHRSGTPLPFLDQWDGEAISLYFPFLQHHLSLADLFQAHSEHRIVFTRLCDLALLLLNGQWDNQLQMVVNAFIHSAAIAGFGWLMARLMGRQCWPWIWLPLALALVLPFAWENTLSGFQSQFYFLLIASGVTIWGLGLNEPWSRGWRLGGYVAVAALFTVAAGFLAAVAVVGLTILDCLKQRSNWRRHLPTWGVCVVITVAGLLLKPDVARHHVLQAHSVGEFSSALGKNLAWPWVLVPQLAPFNLFPLVLLGWIYIRSGEKALPAERMILGIGIWVTLQSLAAAYARGYDGNPPGWRYMDSCSFIMIAGCLSTVLLLTRYRQRLWFPHLWHAGFAIWSLSCLAGLCWLTHHVWKISIPQSEQNHRLQLENARTFMATDDPHAFSDKPPAEIPFPYVEQLVWAMRTPDIRGILPACVREPLRVIPSEAGDASFIPNGCLLAQADPPTEHCWGSYSASGSGARGSFVSTPVPPASLPYLEIPVAGDLGEPGLSLELLELNTGRTTQVRPTQVAGEHWCNAYVRAPAGPFQIVARDTSETRWLAFKAPREMGGLSYRAMQVVAGWPYVLGVGLACLAWSLARRFTRRPEPHAGDHAVTAGVA